MWSTTPGEKSMLASIVRAIEAPRVLEIGAFRGETTRVLAEAAASRGGRVVVIDPMRWAAEIVANGITRHLPDSVAGLFQPLTSWLGAASYEQAFWRNLGVHASSVKLYRALSTDPALLESTAPDLQTFDVVFIDGDHGHSGARHDLERWGARTAPRGTVVVHDAVRRFPGVCAALGEFSRAHDIPVDMPAEDSLALIRVTRPFVLARVSSREPPALPRDPPPRPMDALNLDCPPRRP